MQASINRATLNWADAWAIFDEVAATTFQQLIALKLRVGTQDLLIASTALANKMTLLTRNLRDFQKVPGLTLEDWSIPKN